MNTDHKYADGTVVKLNATDEQLQQISVSREDFPLSFKISQAPNDGSFPEFGDQPIYYTTTESGYYYIPESLLKVVKTTIIEYRIRIGDSMFHIGHKTNTVLFDTEKEAVEEAQSYKANPNNIGENMSEENKEYWKKQTYTIEKVTTEIEVIKII